MNRALMLPLTLAIVVLVSACANSGTNYLAFASTQSFGFDVAAGASTSQPFDFTVGYKSADVSLVPVTAVDGSTVRVVSGCASQTLGISAPTTGCQQIQSGNQANVQQSPIRKTGAEWVDPSSNDILRTSASTSNLARSLQPVASTVLFNLPINQRKVLPPGGETDNMIDAFSVYSSFDTKANASTSGTASNGTGGTGQQNGNGASPQAGISLGKIFATGVAAQQLGQGQNYYLQLAAITQCLSALANAVGAGKVTDTSVCGVAQPTNDNSTHQEQPGATQEQGNTPQQAQTQDNAAPRAAIPPPDNVPAPGLPATQ